MHELEDENSKLKAEIKRLKEQLRHEPTDEISKFEAEIKRLKEQLEAQKESQSNAHRLEDKKVCNLWVLIAMSCIAVPLCIMARA